METIIIAIAAVLLIAVLIVAGVLLARKNAALARKELELVQVRGELMTEEALRQNDARRHEKELKELQENQARAIEAARAALALENEKNLKAREESLRKEAAETMKVITGDLNKDIKDMKEAFEAQKKAHTDESATIRTKFSETVENLRRQTESIGNRAESLASALKGQNKMQGIFGETILGNILKEEGFRQGRDYDAECWLRDRDGRILSNQETGRRMRPDFILHYPDDTDVLIDAKVSLSALSDYFSAETDEDRADASRRNLESVRSHIRELTGKEYQKYVVGRRTIGYVIMFIPNYGAWQLAKKEEPGIFRYAFEQNVLITTEETLIPFLRLIRSAWAQKEQMDNIAGIVDAAQEMVERVGIFCRHNARLEKDLESVLEGFRENTKRLVDGRQSIVRSAMKAIGHGITPPAGQNALPEPAGESSDS